MKVFIDGACEPNPGQMAVGICFEDGNEVSKRLGEGTNNEAEYAALLLALMYLHDKGIKNATIFSDSQLVVNQVNRNWRLKSETSQKYVPEIWEFMEKMNVKLQWIPREKNKRTDALSRKALGLVSTIT